MNLLKRAFLSITRNISKSILIFCITTGLGTLVASTLVLDLSVNQTRNSLWRQLPPAVMVDRDWELVRQTLQENSDASLEEYIVSKEMLELIFELPYVKTFELFDSMLLYSREFERVLFDFPIEWDEQSLLGFPVVEIEITGVSNPNVFQFEMGFNQLVAGRTFKPSEMNPTDPMTSVIILSQQFATLNNLEIGDIIALENNFYEHNSFVSTDHFGNFLDENILHNVVHTFEIIGLFEPVVIPDFGSPMQEVFAHNSMIIPYQVVAEMLNFRTMHWLESGAYVLLTDEELAAPDRVFRTFVNDILLYDAADIPAFTTAVLEIVPEFNRVGTFSNSVIAIQRFESAAVGLEEIVNQAFWITVILMVIALGLVVMLFIRDKKYEIGIYLALGEKNKNIITQLLLEMLVPMTLGIALALLLGQFVANVVGNGMLVNNLSASQNFNLMHDYGISSFAAGRLQWFMENHIDNVISNYNVSIDLQTSLLFFGVGTTTIIAAIFVPFINLMRFKPKEILTFNERG